MTWTISKYVFLAALAVMAALTTTRAAFSAPIIAGKYYEENGSVGCGVGNGCALFFTAVPAGKLLLITRVSCKITEAQNRIVSVTLGQRTNTNGVSRRQYLGVSHVSGTAGLNRFAVNEEANLLFAPAAQPSIELVTDLSEASSFECQIIGQLNPPVF